jgi:ABC-2 type transport system ATP-binding protein
MEVVRADALTKRWGTNTVLDGATFAFGSGVTGLLGSNGSGKTTLFGMLLGFHRCDGGELSVLGLDPWTAGPEVRARIGYAAEHEALPPDVRAHDYVRHVAELHGIPRRAAIARASDALYEVGLGEERMRPLGTMSTGQKQRVKLAQAIAHDPRLVLLDEPTNGLDPIQRDQLLALVRRCGSELGLNVILSSHLLDEVERTCDRVVILANGAAVGGGEVDEIESAGRYVEITVTPASDRERTIAALSAAGAGASADPVRRATLLCEYSGEELFDVIARVLSTERVGVASMRRQHRTLEDAFLEASGGAP